ncbi:hypothetical protein ACIFOT_00860 [Neobacillus sp. NRS-1170]|uniref:hypothetical protein n=1 Tax=Neobacillus sp. NRS-1170 TaxID=3233898 RepID=UPI003D289B6D
MGTGGGYGKSIVVSSNGIKSLQTVSANSLTKRYSITYGKSGIFLGIWELSVRFRVMLAVPLLETQIKNHKPDGEKGLSHKLFILLGTA